MQTTNHILMIRPVDFKFNRQTAVNNKFQQASEQNGVQELALREFDNFAELLRSNGVDVTVINDTLDPETPDSIFPNNWISFHENGEVFLYPMFSENRRLERRKDIIEQLADKFNIEMVTDLSEYENQEIFLEGTGSMVLDREHKLAYACLSLRTDEQVLADWCRLSGYTPVTFKADDQDGFPIYHTNVMMCLGDHFAVICLESIQNYQERELVMQYLIHTGKEIIEISISQMNHFAGNMLQVKNKNGEGLLVMSEQAYSSLTEIQIFLLEKYCRMVHSSLDTIEKNGGGSARCMLAEIHLKKK
ncbi:MAG TPA: arginine deiminase-related protein [Pedobacter sp.]|uniref:citrulline utilization hydrolase CtlX n=1 Tax=Pedobacter sp. TaxID=1411316 RepID=UPI002D1D37FA|nr:arginine deiminase-related protein [Pedobacter sp.]HMI04612.1 arginine deiminase-related protein [Pedobacter sp.]